MGGGQGLRVPGEGGRRYRGSLRRVPGVQVLRAPAAAGDTYLGPEARGDD